MNFDELKQYLRENLEIRIDYAPGFYTRGTYYVELMLEGETISRSTVEVQNRD